MDKNKFIELLRRKIFEATQNISEIEQFQKVGERSFGYKAVYYDEVQVDAALGKLQQWQNVTLDILKTYYGIDKHENCKRFQDSIKNVKGGFDYKKELPREYNNGITVLQGILESLELCGEENTVREDTPIGATRNVFIVHGHDKTKRNEVELFVRSIDYNPIILCKEPSMGQTIIEKIETNAEHACFAIVLYTACDEGKAKEDTNLKPRARQNVVFEHGFMCSKLGRDHVVALFENGIEEPGDLSGVVYVAWDEDSGLWKYSIAKEMIAVGLQVDMSKIR